MMCLCCSPISLPLKPVLVSFTSHRAMAWMILCSVMKTASRSRRPLRMTAISTITFRFAGMHVLEDNLKISAILRDAGGLLARGGITHSYPHSWRSAPLISQHTAMVHLMDTNDLRDTALKAIDETRLCRRPGIHGYAR